MLTIREKLMSRERATSAAKAVRQVRKNLWLRQADSAMVVRRAKHTGRRKEMGLELGDR